MRGNVIQRLVVLAVLSWGVMVHAQPGGDQPAPVRVAEARLMMMSTTILVPGTVVSRYDARIAAEVGGRLVAVADVGAAVEAGAEIARIEDTMLRLRRTKIALAHLN